MPSERLSVVIALRDRLGLPRLTELEERAVLERPPPPRLLSVLADPDPRLTPRQREIMVLLASGFSRPEIAAELGISLETVRGHTKEAYVRLRAHNRVEAVNAFIERAA